MTPEEFDAFIERAVSLRVQAKPSLLSPAETERIKRINRGLPAGLSKRSAQLTQRRKKGILTADEHHELLELTRAAETRDADRAGAFLELARLRGVPLRLLMAQMGIKPQAVHG